MKQYFKHCEVLQCLSLVLNYWSLALVFFLIPAWKHQINGWSLFLQFTAQWAQRAGLIYFACHWSRTEKNVNKCATLKNAFSHKMQHCFNVLGLFVCWNSTIKRNSKNCSKLICASQQRIKMRSFQMPTVSIFTDNKETCQL